MWARNAALYENTAGWGKGPESLSAPSSDSNVLCTLSGVAGQILPLRSVGQSLAIAYGLT